MALELDVLSYGVYSALDTFYPMPEPDAATYFQDTIGTDGDGRPLKTFPIITWLYGDDPGADGGILIREEYDQIKAAITSDAKLTVRTKDAIGNFVKLRGIVTDTVPGVSFVAGLALGVYIELSDCEVVP
jgi:hypothetical protein